MWTDLPLRYITQREERLREKRKMSQIKINKNLPQGEIPQREKRLRKNLLLRIKTQKSGSAP
jgi:hypothetical protein